MANKEHLHNDLREIEGLGLKSAEALPRLGIGNCTQLAQYLGHHTPQELSKRLAEQGVTISAKRIEKDNWLGQAMKQAARASSEPAFRSEEAAKAADVQEEPGHPAPSPSEVRFDVKFRRENRRWMVTTYDERDGGSIEDHGIDPAEWANWILSQMRSDRRLDFPLTACWAGTASEVGIEIRGIEQSVAERFKSLAAEVSFEISGRTADMLTEACMPVWIHVHTHDLDSETTNHVASARVELEPGQFAYKERLEFPIPEVGRYELHTLVVLLPPVGQMALHRGCAFRIVASK